MIRPLCRWLLPTALLALALGLAPARAAGAGWLVELAPGWADLHSDALDQRLASRAHTRGLDAPRLVRPLAPGWWLLSWDATASAWSELRRGDDPFQTVEADRWVRPRFVPNDPRYPDQWNLYDSFGLHADRAWDDTRGAAGITVALLDTGILAHRDLAADRVLPGYDFISDPQVANDGDGRDPDATDPGDATADEECGAGVPGEPSSWHGLLMAGIILADADNGTDIAGIDHRARLLPVRVLGRCGGLLSDIIAALRWSAGLSVSGVPANPHPADVINLSFSGIGGCDTVLQQTLNSVTNAGSTVVVAAGNSGGGDAAEEFPASCDKVVTVTATDRSGGLAGYASQGQVVDIAAPGGSPADPIISLNNTGTNAAAGDGLELAFGTSLAAAHVSGVVALMYAVHPALTPAQALRTLQDSAQAFGDAGCNAGNCGAGIVDAAAAVAAVRALAGSSSQTATNPPTQTRSPLGGSSGGGALSPWLALALLWMRHRGTSGRGRHRTLT